MTDNIEKTEIIPVLPLRGLPIFPYMVIHFDVAREVSANAINAAMNGDRRIFIAAQCDPEVESVQCEDLYCVGTVCDIKQVLRLSDNTIRVLVEGKYRAEALNYNKTEPYFECRVELFPESLELDPGYKLAAEAYVRDLKVLAAEYFTLVGRVPEEINISFAKEKNPVKFSDMLASALMLDLDEKQQLLEEYDLISRFSKMTDILCHEIEVLKIEREISVKTRGKIDEEQRKYFLREQLKVIHEELGEEDLENEIEEYNEKIDSSSMTEDAKKRARKDVKRLSKMHSSSPDASVIRTYLDRLLELPWGIKTEEMQDMALAEKILKDSHYGLDKVKERIIEFLAVRKLSAGKKSPVICLVGPPGVGKTSIARAVADALGRKYVRMSLGGVYDEAEIRGHRRTYIGAMPGRIINAVKQAGSFNPLILLDEIDKLGSDYKGSVSAALLEVLDTEQNFSFRDHYLECETDLSDVLFFTTANSLDTIERPLLDRMEVIEINGYTDEEKLCIAKEYIIAKQLKENGLKKSNLRFSDDAILDIIHHYTRESGVRELERKIAAAMRKAASKIVTKGKKSVSVSSKNLEKFIGRRVFDEPNADKKDRVGVATGLAWTQYGGDTLSIEVNTMDGSGDIELTGQLGDVMKESAKAAISYIRTNASTLGVDADFHGKKDLHIHIPEGAVPKDGPSAGITMATAIVSSLTGKKVSKNVAMTGEITITGRILPIGGLKEKSLAAYRAGIKTILIPRENLADTYELPEKIRKDINFVVADSMEKVLSTALLG